MLKSARFVIERTINPAIELYEDTKNLEEPFLSKANKSSQNLLTK